MATTRKTTTPTTKPLRVVQLTAENIKRLRAVDITPNQHVQVITGRNAQGKTSVLDALWLALGGGPAKRGTPKPVRDGEARAEVKVDLGDLIVTRTWTTNDKSTLKVTSAEGASFSSPQAMLDDLVGRISFDPLAFTQLDAKAQKSQLLELVDLPFDVAELDASRKTLFDQRTDVGRELKAAQGHLESMPPVPDDTPGEEVSAAQIIAEIREAETRNGAIDLATRGVENLRNRVMDINQQMERLAAERERLVKQGLAAAAELATLGEKQDTTELEATLGEVEQINRNVRINQETREARTRRDQLKARQDELTREIESIDQTKASGLAGAKFPVDGLGFDDQGVTYLGQPFEQASGAEKIRVSLGIAMALNPTLRVIRILDGSLLDSENMRLIADMAKAGDYQVWVERVEDHSDTAVVIDDGQVVG